MRTSVWADEARDLLLSLPVFYKMETVSLEEARGRVLAEDLYAQIAMPPFDRSPYDGFALRGEDTAAATKHIPVTLQLLEDVPAGFMPKYPLVQGTATKVMTGAPVPKGTNCVVPYECTKFDQEQVRIFSPLQPNTNVIYAGEEIPLGQLLLSWGSLLTPSALGMLASQGYDTCRVYAKPEVALLTTGTELQAPGKPLQPGMIYDSNLETVGSFLEALGLNCTLRGRVIDQQALIVDWMEKALSTSDLVITTGGASVGEWDFAVRAVKALGADVLFWKVKIKPGSCMLAARKGDKLILSLSGNPGAALTGLIRVALPYLHKLCGRKNLMMQEIEVMLKHSVSKSSKNPRILRGHLEVEQGKAYFVENNRQGNGMISAFYGGDLLAETLPNSPPLAAGTPIKAYCLPGRCL